MNLNQFSTKIDVAAATMAELVAFYNSVTGKAIKKFETRGKGVERCTALLKPEGAPAPTGVNPETAPKAEVTKIAKAETTARKAERKPSKGTRQMFSNLATGSAMAAIAKTVVKADKKQKAKVKPKAKPAKKLNGTVVRGKALFTELGTITLVHKGANPKRGTAAERFTLYRSGMTVSAYIAAGGQRRDVVWDQHQGWITVKG